MASHRAQSPSSDATLAAAGGSARGIPTGPAPAPVATSRRALRAAAEAQTRGTVRRGVEDAPVVARTHRAAPTDELVTPIDPVETVEVGTHHELPTRRSVARTRRGTVHAAAPAAAHQTSSPARWGARAGVLATLAAITVAIPVSQQAVQADDGAEPVAESAASLALPDTVEALTSTSVVAVPPASLVSSDVAAVRAQIQVSRGEERQSLPGCDGIARSGGTNGKLPAVDLCTLWDGSTQLRADAAVALAELNSQWVARFGTDLCLASGYRTYAQQVAVKAEKGGLAAPAGRSNHGWGLAIDFCTSQTTGVQWQWLNENAPIYGWENPAWAQPGGSGPHERWHWEYTKGVMADGEYFG